MYNFIQKFHSGWAYLALLILIIAVVNLLLCLLKKEFTLKIENRHVFMRFTFSFSRYHFIFCFSNGLQMIKAVGMGGLTTESRLALEHPLINIIAITLQQGWFKHKKILTSESKFKTFYFYGLGLVLILSRILENFCKIESKL
jgi:hypothetical protein